MGSDGKSRATENGTQSKADPVNGSVEYVRRAILGKYGLLHLKNIPRNAYTRMHCTFPVLLPR